jgi:cytidine deaminase
LENSNLVEFLEYKELKVYEMLRYVGYPCGFCPKILIEWKSKVMHMFDEQNNQHHDERLFCVMLKLFGFEFYPTFG